MHAKLPIKQHMDHAIDHAIIIRVFTRFFMCDAHLLLPPIGPIAALHVYVHVFSYLVSYTLSS